MNMPKTMSPPARRSFVHRVIIDWRSASERGSMAIQDIQGRSCSMLSAIATLSAPVSLTRHGRMASVCTAESVILAIVSGDEAAEFGVTRELLAVGVTDQLVE